MRRLIAFGHLALVLSLLYGCGPVRKAGSPDSRAAVPVVVRKAATRDVSFSIVKTAVLRADKTIALRFALPGNVSRFIVAENTEVKDGQAIALLDAAPFRARLRQAALKLEELEKQRARIERFYKKQMATQVEYDRINTACAQLREQVRVLNDNLDKLVLRSPANALFLKRLVEPGAFVTPAMTVAELISIRPLKADVEFSDAERREIPFGKTLSLHCNAFPGRVFYARTASRHPAVEPYSQLSRVELLVENKAGLLRPGMMVETEIVTGRRRRVVTLPVDTLVFEGDELSVYVLDRQTSEARCRKVKIGKFFRDRVIIEEGVKPGEPVIVAGQGFIHDRSAVRLVEG